MRHTKIVQITDAGRDKGKEYEITEMSADAAEWWATRALLAIGKSGIDIGEMENLGMQGVAILGIKSFFKLDPATIKPLLDEMWTCVQRKEAAVTRPLADGDVEEVRTRVTLRAEIFTLHTGFSMPGSLSTSTLAPGPVQASENTQTSPRQSARSYPPRRQR